MVDEKTPDNFELEEDLNRARALAKIMDSQFNIMGVEVGADAILGLLPGLGDTLSMTVACYPIHIAHKHDLGSAVQLRMAGNVAIDWAVGLVPLIGDLFDVAFKANTKNVKLLEEAIEHRKRRNPAR